MKSWTDRRRRALELWVEEAKAQLGLADWTVHHSWEPNEHTSPDASLESMGGTALATMTSVPSSKHAILTVSKDLLNLPLLERHQALIHELVHCHLFSIHAFSQENFEMAVEDNELAKKIFNHNLTEQIERATDGLADTFARLIPPAYLD